ncbi:MAG: hypothetical protein FJW40_09800 [Acidobacteria bacterium]|nr:hypothetical protein [Acidobacteriota bacterium]
MKILVVGGYDPSDPDAEEIRAWAASLGQAIVQRGHTLIGGCMTGFDADVARAANEAANGAQDRVISYVLAKSKPSHEIGRLINSQLTSWDPGHNHDIKFAPEPIHQADVIVLVRGYEGSRRAAHWARFLDKPILPVAYFGGAAKDIYDSIRADVPAAFKGRLDLDDFETLNAYGQEARSAGRIVELAERAAMSRRVMVVMSYRNEKELKNYYDAVCTVCQSPEFSMSCARVDQTNTRDHLRPRIVEEIRHTRFVIADITHSSPNVLFELGFARGIGRDTIVTAKEGTQLPFDVADLPCTFWDPADLLTFREELAVRVRQFGGAPGHHTTAGGR